MVLSSVAVGGQVTASSVNQLVDVLAGPLTYTPTVSNWSSATIAPTTTGRYWLHGGMCTVMVQSKLGTGTITVGQISFTLPLTMDTTGMIAQSTLLSGTSSMRDVSGGTTGYYGGGVRIIDSTSVNVMRPSASAPGVLATTTSVLPFTWATLDEFSAFFSYPVA